MANPTGWNGGRPSKLTAEAWERILFCLKLSGTHAMAARLVGVHPDTFGTWYRTNAEFRSACDAAEEESKTVLLGCLHKQARQGSTAAATWLLERRGGREFAPPRQQIDMEVTLDVSSLPDDELTKIAAAEPLTITEAARAS